MMLWFEAVTYDRTLNGLNYCHRCSDKWPVVGGDLPSVPVARVSLCGAGLLDQQR